MIEQVQYLLEEFESPVDKWVALKELDEFVKTQLKVLQEDVTESVDSGEAFGKVTKVNKTTIKTKDSIVKFLEDRDLLRLVKKDDIDMSKLNQLVEAGVINEEELEEHLERKQSSYLKKGKVI